MSINDYPSKLTGSSYYYVRMAWEDEESQLGQYRTLKSAVAKADENPGAHIFTGDGISIYPDDDEAVTVSEETEETSTDAPEPAQDEQEQAESDEDKEVVAAEEVAAESGSDASEDAVTEQTVAEGEYPNDGNTEPILYAKANTLLNVRAGNSIDAEKLTVIRKGTLVEVLEECDNGWLRIKSDAAGCGYAYVSGEYLTTGSSIYTVQPADTLWKIAEVTLNSGKSYTDIKSLNGLTSNVIRVGMVLLIP